MMNDRPASLGDALPMEMARVRDRIMPAYLACGRAGEPALFLMRRSLDAAATAMAEGDVVNMIASLQDLREWQL